MELEAWMCVAFGAFVAVLLLVDVVAFAGRAEAPAAAARVPHGRERPRDGNREPAPVVSEGGT